MPEGDDRLPWRQPALKKGEIGVETANTSGAVFDGGAFGSPS